MLCETPDVMFPMTAEVSYSVAEQSPYGAVTREWSVNKVIAGNFLKDTSGLVTDPLLKKTQVLSCMIKSDIRISSVGNEYNITNIRVSDIKDRAGNQLYVESSGPRKGQPTLFEVATQDPHIGPFGSVEYYELVLRRSENQGDEA